MQTWHGHELSQSPLITNAHHHAVCSGARDSKFQLQIPRNNTPVSAMSDYADMRSCSLGLTPFITQQPSLPAVMHMQVKELLGVELRISS